MDLALSWTNPFVNEAQWYINGILLCLKDHVKSYLLQTFLSCRGLDFYVFRHNSGSKIEGMFGFFISNYCFPYPEQNSQHRIMLNVEMTRSHTPSHCQMYITQNLVIIIKSGVWIFPIIIILFRGCVVGLVVPSCSVSCFIPIPITHCSIYQNLMVVLRRCHFITNSMQRCSRSSNVYKIFDVQSLEYMAEKRFVLTIVLPAFHDAVFYQLSNFSFGECDNDCTSFYSYLQFGNSVHDSFEGLCNETMAYGVCSIMF